MGSGTVLGVSESLPEKSEVLPEVYACLWVSGTFDPALLTELFGVQPKKAHRAGDPILRGATRAATDMWHYSTEQEATFDLPDHIESILAMVRPHVARFNEFRQAYEVEVEVHLIVWMDDQAPIGLLTPSMINEIAAIGAALEIDLYRLSAPTHENG
jgi:hypothetical protein